MLYQIVFNQFACKQSIIIHGIKYYHYEFAYALPHTPQTHTHTHVHANIVLDLFQFILQKHKQKKGANRSREGISDKSRGLNDKNGEEREYLCIHCIHLHKAFQYTNHVADNIIIIWNHPQYFLFLYFFFLLLLCICLSSNIERWTRIVMLYLASWRTNEKANILFLFYFIFFFNFRQPIGVLFAKTLIHRWMKYVRKLHFVVVDLRSHFAYYNIISFYLVFIQSVECFNT